MRLGVSLYKMSTLPSSLLRCSSRLQTSTELPLYPPASLLWQSLRLKSEDAKTGKNARPLNLKDRQEPPRTAGLNPNDQNDQGPQTSDKRFDKDSSKGNVGSLKQVPNSATSTKNYNDGGRPSGASRGIQASDYKVQEYHNHDKYTFYDIENQMTKDRLQQPDADAPMVPDTKR
ncbi:hypothetical protein RvY_03165 [Ramazzottius varieornatus]|uniref:Uncharacterized protein n=1 Tax=Ramazzottius varieornatus TaxID=947166 RepID=A0A1D1UM35_RAMVA|nr:hypothetical protein RvY_03165 [Ramazzottius varieornatus]